MNLGPLGDRAFLAHFETEVRARAWAMAVRDQLRSRVADVVVAYEKVAVFAGPDVEDLDTLEGALKGLDPGQLDVPAARRIIVPVLYDGEDLVAVAEALGCRVEDVIVRHASVEYVVQAIGFLPGFPYAGDLPDGLRGLPRRASPRVRVPTWSVAIAGRQTCIYPCESPGGWHLLGRTPCQIVDLASAFFPIAVGDSLTFVPIGAREFESLNGLPLGGKVDAGSVVTGEV
jgi:KipI family sensor histidine kinase inhibitor